MQCDYFDANRCRSCTLMGLPHPAQVTRKDEAVRAALAEHTADDVWQAPFTGPESGFRNKAKLVVGGVRAAPTLGILDHAGAGVDLRDCALHEPGLQAAVPLLAEHVAEVGLTPYDVPRRSGELKGILATVSPTGELMIRFVLRSPGQLPRLRRSLAQLHTRLPSARVVSGNLLPEHKAVPEGDEEVVLTAQGDLSFPVNDVVLRLRPRSFFQTNTAVAAGLYAQAREWVEHLSPRQVTDLYCGVGGFALHLAAPGRQVLGVEVSQDAVESARSSARTLRTARPCGDLRFVVADATRFAAEPGDHRLVVVNPPRRGIGPLATQLQDGGPAHVLYSSCNVATLASDLAAMPRYRVVAARWFDMFPQTDHAEVMVLLRRR